MPNIKIETRNQCSQVLITRRWRSSLNYFNPGHTVIITDRHLQRLYQADWPTLPVIVMPPGERAKNINQVQAVYRRLLEMGVERHWTIVGFGGGVVTDIAGFCAATYLRGVDCILVATSLLAQVDASIGGKNGINFGGVKNIIGTIVQPRVVICPQDVLATLPHCHFLNGLAEVIKVAAIGDDTLFDLLNGQRTAILARQPDVLEEIIVRAVSYKAQIVKQDERECGVRRILNFGHTFGHAIEMSTHSLHGFAVATGMVWAAKIGRRLGITPADTVQALEKLVGAYNLPVAAAMAKQVLLALISKDKKRQDAAVNFVVLEKIGRARTIALPLRQLAELIDDLHLAG